MKLSRAVLIFFNVLLRDIKATEVTGLKHLAQTTLRRACVFFYRKSFCVGEEVGVDTDIHLFHNFSLNHKSYLKI